MRREVLVEMVEDQPFKTRVWRITEARKVAGPRFKDHRHLSVFSLAQRAVEQTNKFSSLRALMSWGIFHHGSLMGRMQCAAVAACWIPARVDQQRRKANHRRRQTWDIKLAARPRQRLAV